MPILNLDYTLSKDTAHKGLCQWYFLKNRVKNIIYCVILGSLFVNFLLSIIFLKQRDSVFLLFASVFAICMLFAVPPFQLKSYAAAYGEGEDFVLSVFEDKLEVVSSKTSAEIEFSKITAVFNCKSFICIETYGKLFPIPKTPENAEITEKIGAFLKEKLPNFYKR